MEPKRTGPKDLGELAREKRAEMAAAPTPNGEEAEDVGPCMKIIRGSCFGFEIELADKTVHAYPYHTFGKMILSPNGSVLELELSGCKVTFKGQRLRFVLSAMRRGYDVVLKTVDAKYEQTVEPTQPAITEIKIEIEAEAEAAVGRPADPADGDERIEPLEQP